MKGVDIFCASQASTAICLGMEHPSSSSTPLFSSTLLPGRAIDRYNPIIRDSKRIPKPLPPCAESEPPISPKPIKNQTKKKNEKAQLKENGDQDKIFNSKEKTAHDGNDSNGINNVKAIARKSWSCTRPGGFISPPGSTRYLLSEKVFSKEDLDPALKSQDLIKKESCDEQLPSESPKQVVVLKVSLHCRGCEKKMKKHISRMEGVTSFDIDFMAKKVTVVGNVTPLGVLSSISKVKNAQLWPPTTPSSFPQNNFSGSEFKNEYKVAGA